MNKTESQRIHAKKRLAQRFGMKVNREMYAQINQIILSGNSKPLSRQSNRVTIHQVTIAGHLMKVAYDKLRHQIITVMYMDRRLRDRGETGHTSSPGGL